MQSLSRKTSTGVVRKISDFLRSSKVCASVILRSLGLQIVRPLQAWRKPEEPKIAVQKSIPLAMARASIHTIPVIGCLIILGYNARVTFVVYDSAYSALQFVAKLHEIMMQASIAAIVLGYIRHQLIGQSAVPFGALVAASQTQNASSLLSLEFWGALTASSFRDPRSIATVTLISLGVLLASTVGPSSAILLLPRGMRAQVGSWNWYVNETIYFPPRLTNATVGFSTLR